MQIDFLNREELQEFIFQFEQALYNHQQWYNSIIRSLVCRLPSDQHDISVNAHKECRFGQWYYGPSSHKLKQHPAFIALGEEHQYMHKAATTLLVSINKDNNISPHDYDIFSNSIEKLHLEISALQRELNELLYSRDPLTGTINRNNMLPVLREQQELVKRQVQLCCIAMLDLDKFKTLNDQHGHPAGDCVLATISRFVIESMRPYDKVFRVGGDEFLLCLQNTNTALALEIIERIRSGIAKMTININSHESVHITASFGLTSLKADISIEQAIDQADQALYKAKKEGRNCVRII
ncbi:regulatory protein (GGDEF, PAS, PAC domains) [Legionella gratiana]|uniref:diguanylate cyclase n=1 Tax=Legionella gratiana TaxID=45066 RepID=A0A378JCK6_9GAMM|nr:diguanylate cyclase [Legionella gratiana]KTD11039.1 regulatory protein (GGDEF, PAS, PAC domains) [Legionella gratiana]STX44617.1 Diguanylate kinase [Legionella gratiana]